MTQGQQRQVTFQEYIGGLRGNIVISYDQAKEVALKAFDDITAKLIEQIQVNEALRAPKENPVKPKPEQDKSRNKKSKK